MSKTKMAEIIFEIIKTEFPNDYKNKTLEDVAKSLKKKAEAENKNRSEYIRRADGRIE